MLREDGDAFRNACLTDIGGCAGDKTFNVGGGTPAK
jgi:hypothetical protein